MSAASKYRLVTRSDFDGLVCAVLLRDLDIIDDIKFVHPKDVQDGKVLVTSSDIMTNLPYAEAAYLCFDHHESEEERVGGKKDNHILEGQAPSAARVVFEYYGGKKKFPRISDDMMIAVDKADSAKFSMTDILNPQGWELLSFIMDARTGLGRFREFSISNYQLMMDLIEYCRNKKIKLILEHPDVAERVNLYNEHKAKAKDQIRRCTKVFEDVVVLDLRSEDTIFATNRFMIYALYPQCRVSIHVLWGLKKQNTVFACGKSILDRTAGVNLGSLMLEYGGGGHAAAATCQVDNENADAVLQLLVEKIHAAGCVT